jgi:hypothetical protein
MSALPTFHPFARLPRELQIDIWAYTLEPRRISFKTVHKRYPLQAGGQIFSELSIHSSQDPSSKLPAALSVHKQSRNFILTRYPLWNCKGINIRVNVKLDILHIVDESDVLSFDCGTRWLVWILGDHLRKEQVTQIRFLEVDLRHCIEASWRIGGPLEMLHRFKDLKVIVLRVSARVASERGTLAALFERQRTERRGSG